MPLVDSMNRTNRNLSVLRDALKIISERQKESREELLETISSKLEALSAKGNKDGIRYCQQFVINYEDSIRRRYQMEHEAAMRDNIGRLMIQQSEDIRKNLK